jgi:hypothetical protein
MTDFPGSGRVRASPPVAFPVYRLDASWPGTRWLEQFGDVAGDPPRFVSLGHQSPAGDARVVVTTFLRQATGDPRSYRMPTDEQAARQGQSPLQYAAADAAIQLVDLTLPVVSLARPAGFLRTLVEHADDAGREYAQWPAVTWRVDGAAVQAWVWWFAGGWAAFTDAVPGAHLVAVGVGVEPAGLPLAVLQDGAAYHFELDQPLAPGVMSASAAAAGLTDEKLAWQRRDWHPDQLRLMREPGQRGVR